MVRHLANLSFVLTLLSIAALNPMAAQEPSLLSAGEYTERGIACLRTDDFDGAIINFGKAIALNPSRAVSYLRRGVTYMERGVDRRNKADLSLAMADLDKAIGLDPRNATYYFSRGSIKLYQWKDQEAELDFRKSLGLDGKQKPEMDRVIGVIKKRRKAARMR